MLILKKQENIKLKKILGIVVLGLLWCGTANAEDNKICDWAVNGAYPDILNQY